MDRPAAALDNARWCDAVCRSHGIATRWDGDAWSCTVRTPPFYPDAVTLVPAADALSLLARIDDGPGASVKDSFADLDLAPHGYEVLFEATWIGRDPGHPVTTWSRVDGPAALARWAHGWDRHRDGTTPFRAALLAESAVTLVGTADGTAGCALLTGPDAVGLSNLFAPAGGEVAALGEAVGAAAMFAPGRPVVGYEAEEALTRAVTNGFAPLGPLRVWLRPG